MADRNTATLLDEQSAPTAAADVALTPVENASLVLMFERLAKDPAVDVEKLQRLIDMQKDILRINAEAKFWDEFARMQGDLPTITEDGAIAVNGVVRSRYSTNENIQEVIRPILQRYGFALSFRNATRDGVQIVTGILAGHGHKETDTFESAPDSGGSMNSIQRIGSTRSYGQRYTSIALLNIVSRAPQDRDDDGERGGMKDTSDAPEGYDPWLATLEGVADEGMAKFSQAWNRSPESFRRYLARTAPKLLNSIKDKAGRAGKAS